MQDLLTSKIFIAVVTIIVGVLIPFLRPYVIKLINYWMSYTKLSFDFINHGNPTINFGKGEKEFDINWSVNSFQNIFLYNQRTDNVIIGIIPNVHTFTDFFDISKYFQTVPPNNVLLKGQHFIVRNLYGKLAVVKFESLVTPGGGTGRINFLYKILK
jgi:hypothetical protein